MANPGRAGEIIWLLAVKVVIAVAAGYFVDGVMQKYIVRTEKNVHIKTRETVRSSKMEVVREAIGHTFRIFIYLFVFFTVSAFTGAVFTVPVFLVTTVAFFLAMIIPP